MTAHTPSASKQEDPPAEEFSPQVEGGPEKHQSRFRACKGFLVTRWLFDGEIAFRWNVL